MSARRNAVERPEVHAAFLEFLADAAWAGIIPALSLMVDLSRRLASSEFDKT
jgi:hypothetical protein